MAQSSQEPETSTSKVQSIPVLSIQLETSTAVGPIYWTKQCLALLAVGISARSPLAPNEYEGHEATRETTRGLPSSKLNLDCPYRD